MIDIESEVFSKLKLSLSRKYKGISVGGVYVNSPPSFPYVHISEIDSYVSRLNSAHESRFSIVTYEINIYSNDGTRKKSQCKNIAIAIDEVMYALNFTRLSLTPVPNMNDSTIYRLVARYRAETDGENIYRR